MNQKSRRFLAVDIFYLVMMILPILAAITLSILFSPASEGVEISGALIYYGEYEGALDSITSLIITESQINSLCVVISLIFLCLYLTHGLRTRNISKRQMLAEWIVEKVENLVTGSMGPYFAGFSAFIAAMLALSGFSSLMSLFGLYPPTSDLNVVAGWAVVAFILITYYKLKCGPLHYVKNLASPILLTPLNVIGEVATPVSMAFRHYGNVMSGAVIAVLVGTALSGLSSLLLGWLPGVLGEIPFLQIGIPAVLSVYFDLFSGCLQAYIFAMLTMMYVSDGFPYDEYMLRKERKNNNKKIKKQAMEVQKNA